MASRATIKKEVIAVLMAIRSSDDLQITENTKLGAGGVGLGKGFLENLNRAMSRISTAGGGKAVRRKDLGKLAEKKVKDLIDLVKERADER